MSYHQGKLSLTYTNIKQGDVIAASLTNLLRILQRQMGGGSNHTHTCVCVYYKTYKCGGYIQAWNIR